MKAFALALLLTSAAAVQIGTQAQAEDQIENVEDVEVEETGILDKIRGYLHEQDNEDVEVEEQETGILDKIRGYLHDQTNEDAELDEDGIMDKIRGYLHAQGYSDAQIDENEDGIMDKIRGYLHDQDNEDVQEDDEEQESNEVDLGEAVDAACDDEPDNLDEETEDADAQADAILKKF